RRPGADRDARSRGPQHLRRHRAADRAAGRVLTGGKLARRVVDPGCAGRSGWAVAAPASGAGALTRIDYVHVRGIRMTGRTRSGDTPPPAARSPTAGLAQGEPE